MKRRKCKYCGSEFVFWNWIYSPFWKTWIYNLQWRWREKIYFWRTLFRFWNFFDRWAAECWNCNSCQHTFFKVKNISHEDLKKEFKDLPEHEMRDQIEELNYLFRNGYLWQEEYFNRRIETAKEIITKLILEEYIKARVRNEPYIYDILKNDEENNNRIDSN